MQYKMLVLDMDDTLLTDDHQVSVRNQKMIRLAQEMGVYVVLASGRPTPAMLSYAKDLGLDQFGSYILSYNGAVITAMQSGEVIFEQSIQPQHVHELYDFSVAHQVHLVTYLDGEIIATGASPYVEIEAHITGMPLRIVSDFKATVQKPVVKCIMLEEPSYLAKVAQTLKNVCSHKSITTSKPFFLEIMEWGIDKAASLARLAAQLNIDASEIIAVGNASNDLSMIQYAGLGVWVDNVEESLRHHADVIVASNNNDGVAEVIERFILGEQIEA